MTHMKNIQTILKDTFWLETFREGQQEIIEHIIEGNDTLVFMPTWGGKSLTYQLPGLVREGICIVISPLISLMKDQVDKLNSLQVRAELLNSTLSAWEKHDLLEELRRNHHSTHPIKFLYIAPERLHSQEFREVLLYQKISLIAIDEAHCISQWGHDFRPSYMKIRDFILTVSQFPDKNEKRLFPVVGLTATATQKVREDIVERLWLLSYKSFISGFDRKNICIIVREISAKDEKQKKVKEIIEKTPGIGIIYCSSRKHVVELSEYLITQGIATGIYKGDLNTMEREQEQNAFMNDNYKVIVATNAFGMGIDKKDIRFVIHYNLPGSIESYYQEIGRAGRDGKMSYAVVLASYGDTKIQEFFIENTYPTQKEVLQFYSYLYKDMRWGEGKDSVIAKTQFVMASESGIENDMKVGSIIKILEKYGILERGADSNFFEEGFRGRGITLLEGKKETHKLSIDWKKQEYLLKEAYHKLDEMKQLLFYPSCRKRYILEYFWDREDLEKLPENCGLCDYCIESKKYSAEDVKHFLPLSSYEFILETVQKYNERFGKKLFVSLLLGSTEKQIIDWNLDLYEHHGALKDLWEATVSLMLEALIHEKYIESSWGKYPCLSLTGLWKRALKYESSLKERYEDMNRFILQKLPQEKKRKKNISSSGEKKKWGQSAQETLLLFQKKIPLAEIAKTRNLSLQTIEQHIIELYKNSNISLFEILSFIDISDAKNIGEILKSFEEFPLLKEIKTLLENKGHIHVSYFQIHLACAMFEKKDI